MKTSRSLVASLLAFAALLPNAAQSAPFGNTGTYTNVVWSVSTTVPQFAGCSEVRIDATGDLNNSNRLSIYGAQNCLVNNDAFPLSGMGIFAADGKFNMNLFVGSGFVLQCYNWTGLSGSCKYVSLGSGALLGTAFLTLR